MGIVNKEMPGLNNTQHFLGVIMDINDPLKKGRCKIKVFGLFDDLETADLPWAFQIYGDSFADQGGSGRFSTPKIGAVVNVRFNNGDYYSPEYSGIQELGKGLQDELSDSYEGTHSLIYDGIEKVKIFYTKKKGLILEVDKSTINITNDKQINIKSTSKINVSSTDVINVNSKNINVTSEQTTTIEGKNIKLGKNAIESVIKGDTFKTLYDSHTHIGNLGAPTGPPIVPLAPNALSTKSKTE